MGRRAYAYHATCEDHLDGIRAHGLLPNDGTRGFWPDGYEVLDRLFLCTTQDGADYYADAIRSNAGLAAMLRFPLPAERTHDPRTDSGDGWWIVRAPRSAGRDRGAGRRRLDAAGGGALTCRTSS